MKKWIFAMALLVSGFAHAQASEWLCSTQSRGLQFRVQDRDYQRAGNQVVYQCQRDPRTNPSECSRNVSCSQVNNPGYPGYPGNPGNSNGQIYASPNPCYVQGNQGACTSYISFRLNSDRQIAVATVIDRNDPYAGERVFACHQGQSPQNPASWIQRNHRYEFRLYAVRDCNQHFSQGRYLNSVEVQGR